MDGTESYHAALNGAALYDENADGRIRMRGESSADLLHRLSTNEIVKLRPAQGARTVLTTPIGRIIDLLTVYVREDSVVVITSPGQGGPVFSHLRKNIFFNDKVTLEPLGRSHAQFALYGPQAAELLAGLSGQVLDDMPLHGSTAATLAGNDVLIARTLPIGGAGFRLIVPAETAEHVREAVMSAGAQPLDEPTFDVLRVEHGYGAVGRELSQEYIPLETGLGDAISFSKGCYVGQEIIARMESRGRLAKTLRGLRLSDMLALPEGAPAKLDAEGKESGDVTSVVMSPRFGPVALAYVRMAHAEPGTRLQIAGSEVVGEVVELPFA